MIALYLFATSFIYVFLKAGQQRNVAFDHYKLIPPFSFGMAATEVYIISAIATHGYDFYAVLGMGFGGSTGALLAMYLHKRFVTKKDTA